MQRHFDEELGQLKERLLTMAGMAERAVGKSIQALVDRNSALAEEVIREDALIDRLEVDIEQSCLSLLARYQPEAKDLRFVAMVFKIVNDLERVGDQSVNVSERTLDLLKQPLLKPLIDIPRMAELAQAMLKDALDAFVNQNADLARAVCRRDEQVDHLNDQVFHELLVYMTWTPRRSPARPDLVGRTWSGWPTTPPTSPGRLFPARGESIKHRLAGV